MLEPLRETTGPQPVGYSDLYARNATVVQAADWDACPDTDSREMMRLRALAMSSGLASNGWAIEVCETVYKPMGKAGTSIATDATTFGYKMTASPSDGGALKQFGEWTEVEKRGE